VCVVPARPCSSRAKGNLLQEALRLGPDVVRLSRELIRDPDLPRSAKVRL
jgi:hypothetical protein